MPKNEDVGPVAGWDGFYEPNYTAIPDDFFDILLAQLTDVEIRVLLYIMRRTYGFKKRSDTISLSQITDGIMTKDGERLDHGAGVSKNGATIAIGRLEARGIVIAERRRGPDRSHLPTSYRLRMHGQALSPPETRVVPGGDKGNTLSPPGTRIVSVEDKGSTHQEQALVPGGDTQETVVTINSKQEDTSGAVSSNADNDTAPPPYSPWIAQVVMDHVVELGDKGSGVSSVEQVLRLWATSGLTESAFVELLHQARAATRKAQGTGGGVSNKARRYIAELERFAGKAPR